MELKIEKISEQYLKDAHKIYNYYIINSYSNFEEKKLTFNQFHKNANLPYLECAQNNLKKDNKNSTIINNHSFLRPQRAVLGINPMLDNSINSNKHEVRTNILNTKKSNEKKEFQIIKLIPLH